MKVNIPFAFSVENHALTDGEYLVFTVSQGWILVIVSTDGKHSAIVNTLPDYGRSPSRTAVWCSKSTATNISWRSFGPPDRTWDAIRCPASARWRSPAAEKGPRPLPFSPSLIAANELTSLLYLNFGSAHRRTSKHGSVL